MQTSPLTCRGNQWTGFYMIDTSIMKKLKSIYFLQNLKNPQFVKGLTYFKARINSRKISVFPRIYLSTFFLLSSYFKTYIQFPILHTYIIKPSIFFAYTIPVILLCVVGISPLSSYHFSRVLTTIRFFPDDQFSLSVVLGY